MADIIEYTVDERPIYGFEILPETPVEPGRTYRGGGYFTHNEHAAWSWVSLWINGQRVVDARLLVGSLGDWPELIEEAVQGDKYLSLGLVHPESELTFVIEPSTHRLLRQLALSSAEELEAEEAGGALFLDFAAEETSEDEETGAGLDEAALTSFDVTLMVDGGLIAGFGAARGGPAVVMYDMASEVLLQFAAELREDLIAAGIVEPSDEEAEGWQDVEPEPELATEEDAAFEQEEPVAPESRWSGHYLARPEYRDALEDFVTYIPAGGAILDIGCGTGEGAGEWLAEIGYKVTAIDTWMPSLQIASENEALNVEWADVCELEYEDEFAGAVALHAFLHLDREDLDDAMLAVRRSLKSNGVFLLVLDPAQELLSAPSSPDAPGAMDFIADFTHGEIVEAAREAGFEMLHDLPVEPLEDARDWEERGNGRVMILQAV